MESLPSITPTMQRVQRRDQGPLGVGSEVRIKQPGQPERIWTVTRYDPPHHFSWTTSTMGVQMTGVHDLASFDDGTTNTLAIELAGPLAPILGRLMKRPIQKALATENEGFQVAAE